MQYKVPQDVLRADKIVGFLTLRQLIIVTIGGGITYSIYVVFSKQYFVEVWLPPVAFVGLITMAFAFFKFHDIVFEKFILIFIEYKFRPRARVWEKMRGDPLISVLSAPVDKAENIVKKATALSDADRRKKLEEMSRAVDKRGETIGGKNIETSLIKK